MFLQRSVVYNIPTKLYYKETNIFINRTCLTMPACIKTYRGYPIKRTQNIYKYWVRSISPEIELDSTV